jgi:hypothetical protein
MAASASAAVVGVAAVISDTLAYKIRREIVTGKFARGGEINAILMESKRSQLATWEAARGPGMTMGSKWSRQLTDMANDVTATKAAATEARDSSITAAQNSQAVLNILSGKDAGGLPGQTDQERLNELQIRNRSNHNQIRIIKEREALRLRDLLGETPGVRASREAKEKAAAEKAETAKKAKDEKKADKDKVAAEKKTASDEKKKAAEEKKKAAGEKRTKAADEKDRKRQKTDGLQQIDAKQTMLSFPETPLTLEPPVQEEFVSNYVPTMIQLGVPCGAVQKVGTCPRTDLCGHRSRAQKDDDKAIHREKVDWYTSKAATAQAELVR